MYIYNGVTTYSVHTFALNVLHKIYPHFHSLITQQTVSSEVNFYLSQFNIFIMTKHCCRGGFLFPISVCVTYIMTN